MEAKKSAKADLEKRKGLYLEIGLVVILVASLVAFNVKSFDKQEQTEIVRNVENIVEEEIIQTMEEETPPPPEPEAPEVVTEVKVVDDNQEIKNELGLIDMGDAANKAQEDFTPVKVEVEVEEEEEEIFVFVEQQPTFPGGDDALYAYLGKNIQYPKAAADGNIEGKVYIKFVVEKDGSVSDVKCIRDIGGGCGAEAVRVVKTLPKWTPGKQRGRSVRTYFTLPVAFTLQ